MKIKNLTRGTILAQQVSFARTFKSRLIGLISRPALEKGDSLVLPGCNCIHTFFMRFVIDVLFLDGNGKVVGKAENLSPFRFSPLFWRARTCVELPVRTIKDSLTQISDTILIEP